MPYISAAIIMQLMTSISLTLSQLKKEGEQGRKDKPIYRYGTVLIATAQAYGIAVGMGGCLALGSAVMDPGAFFVSRPWLLWWAALYS